jgi:hypothetical protein
VALARAGLRVRWRVIKVIAVQMIRAFECRTSRSCRGCA